MKDLTATKLIQSLMKEDRERIQMPNGEGQFWLLISDYLNVNLPSPLNLSYLN